MPAKHTTPNKILTGVNTSDVRNNKLVLTKPLIVSLAVLVIVVGVLFSLKNQLIVAWVNGQPITRLDLIAELERQAGKKTLDFLVTKTLILQEANKEHVTVSDKEVNDELTTLKANLSKSGQDYQTLLASQGLTETELKDQIRIQKIVDKIVSNGLTVTEKEVADYIKNNKDQLSLDTSQATVTAQIKNQLLRQKISNATQTWLQALRSKAKISTSY